VSRRLIVAATIVIAIATTGCAPAETDRRCPAFEIDGELEFRPGGSAPVLADLGLIELAVGLCAYEEQHLLIAFAPSPMFAEDYLHRARTLLDAKGADLEEFDNSDSRGFVANLLAEADGEAHRVTVSYSPSIVEEDFGGSIRLSTVGLRPGDGFLLVGYE